MPKWLFTSNQVPNLINDRAYQIDIVLAVILSNMGQLCDTVSLLRR